MSVKDWAEAYRVAERIIRGEAAAGIVWNAEVKEKFRRWLEAEGRSREYIADCIRYLDRYVTVVDGSEDVVAVFRSCERGKPHLIKAFRALLKYYEVVGGFPADRLEQLKRAVPKARAGVDYREVGEKAVLETLRVLEGLPAQLEKYRLVWLLVLDSGVRLSHAVHMTQTFTPDRAVSLEGFIRYSLGIEKGVKHTWYVYIRPSTYALLSKGPWEISLVGVFRFLGKMRMKNRKICNPKLIRKFAFNKMLQLGIPESVADFICGRKPATVGARHYAWLVQQADAHYPKYAGYLDEFFSKF